MMDGESGEIKDGLHAETETEPRQSEALGSMAAEAREIPSPEPRSQLSVAQYTSSIGSLAKLVS